SRAPAFGGGGFDAGAEFFTAPIEAWLEREGIIMPAVIGHSLGGLCAVELALRGRVRLRRFILIGGMGLGPQMTYLSRFFFRAGPERIGRGLGRAIFERIAPPVDTPEGRRNADLDYELYTASPRHDAARAFDALYPTWGPVPHRLARLREIDAPALLL